MGKAKEGAPYSPLSAFYLLWLGLGLPRNPSSLTPQAPYPSGIKEGSFLRTYCVLATIKPVLCMISFDPHNDLQRQELFIVPFHRWGNRDVQKLSPLSELTLQGSRGAGPGPDSKAKAIVFGLCYRSR